MKRIHSAGTFCGSFDDDFVYFNSTLYHSRSLGIMNCKTEWSLFKSFITCCHVEVL